MDIYLDRLLNLPNTTIENFKEIDDFLYFQVALFNEDTTCQHCHNKVTEIHQITYSLIKDLSVFGRKVYLRIPRREFYCKNCHRYTTERLEFMDWKHRHTKRYEEYIYERVKQSTVEQVSREEELGRDEIQRMFNYVGEVKRERGSLPKK